MTPVYEVPWYLGLACAAYLGYAMSMFVNLYEFLYWLLTDADINPNWDPVRGSRFGLGW